jgi:MFS family permease
MSKRQLAVLFSMYALLSILGVGLLPLLPVYATRLGAAPAVVGYYMAFIFAALAAGAVSAGWIFERVGRPRLLLFCCGALNVPLVALMGRAASVWPFAALSAAAFFMGGIGGTLIFILAGLSAGRDERGKGSACWRRATGWAR